MSLERLSIITSKAIMAVLQKSTTEKPKLCIMWLRPSKIFDVITEREREKRNENKYIYVERYLSLPAHHSEKKRRHIISPFPVYIGRPMASKAPVGRCIDNTCRGQQRIRALSRLYSLYSALRSYIDFSPHAHVPYLNAAI